MIDKMLEEFHSHFPTTDESRLVRKTLIKEEALEVVEALENQDRLEIAKELADLVYVAYGTALVWGIDLNEAVRLVHESNLSKFENGKPLLREDGKVLKGKNYKEASMESSLKEMLPDSL